MPVSLSSRKSGPRAASKHLMRLVGLLALLVSANPAMAQYWTHYANARFGYEADIPPDYVGQGESQNGDGQVFFLPGRLQSLAVWGGNFYETADDLEAEAKSQFDIDVQSGLSVSYQSSTPQWAVWSGTIGSRVIYQRVIMLCDGASYAAMRSEYERDDLNAMQEVIEGLVRSFKGTDC